MSFRSDLATTYGPKPAIHCKASDNPWTPEVRGGKDLRLATPEAEVDAPVVWRVPAAGRRAEEPRIPCSWLSAHRGALKPFWGWAG